MRIVAFASTTPALLGGAKTVTRRDWDPAYAARFRAGDLVAAWDRSPRAGGRKVATIRLTDAPILQDPFDAPEGDWEREGFAWMSVRGLLCGNVPPEAVWVAWKHAPSQPLWVVRFALVSVEPPAPPTVAAHPQIGLADIP